MFISQSDGPFQKSLRIPLKRAKAGPWKEVSQGNKAGEALVPEAVLEEPIPCGLWVQAVGA